MLPEREETTQAICVPSFLPGGKLWTVEHEWDPKQNIFKSELWRHKSEFRETEAAGSCGVVGWSSGGEDATWKKKRKEKNL